MHKIGFMQGRLSPPVDGKIQAFPWQQWREEFARAETLGFPLMEWTLDQARLHENPLMTAAGRHEIRDLVDRHGVTVGSLTGDCFMQAPFYKAEGRVRGQLLDDFEAIVTAAGEVGIRQVLIPLVDNGALTNPRQEDLLRAGLEGRRPLLSDAGVQIIFESDFAPQRLRQFIADFPAGAFAINYDIGNSAGLGFDAADEIAAYGDFIANVHVKDRVRGGTTVPLGDGDAELPKVFRLLKQIGYRRNFILQTARAADGDDRGAACRYRDMVQQWLAEAA